MLAGKPRQIRLALWCLLCRGHVLIEDVPGVGKTVLASISTSGLPASDAASLPMDARVFRFSGFLLPQPYP